MSALFSASQILLKDNSFQKYYSVVSVLYFANQNGMCSYMNDKAQVTKQQGRCKLLQSEHLQEPNPILV